MKITCVLGVELNSSCILSNHLTNPAPGFSISLDRVGSQQESTSSMEMQKLWVGTASASWKWFVSCVPVFAWEESPSYLPGGCLPNIGHKGPQTPTGCVIWYLASLILGSVLCCRCQTSTKINERKLRLLFVCLISFCFIWNFIILTVCAPAQQGDGSLSLRLTACLHVHFLFRISCVWMCAHVHMLAHVAFPPCFLRSKWHYRHMWSFMWVLGMWAQALVCVHQALDPPSHLLSLCIFLCLS